MTLRAAIAERKLGYFGHIMRHPCLEKNIVKGMVEGKRRGRPAARWLDDIKEWTGLKVTNTSRLANDRRRWKSLIQTTPALLGAMWLEREREKEFKIVLFRLFIDFFFSFIYYNNYLVLI